MKEIVQQGLPFEVERVGTIERYVMVFPFLPPSKNVYDGWLPAWKSGAKKKWIRAIAREVEIQQIPRAQKVGLAVRLEFQSRNRRDPQNYAQCLWNWIPDGLVRAGVIPDDDDGRVEIGPNWGLEMTVGKQQRTIVMVTLRRESWLC